MSLNRTQSFCLKFQLGNELRKVSKIPANLTDLRGLLQSLYGRENFQVIYQDEEGDDIIISTENELKDLLAKSVNKPSLKLVLKETEQFSFVDQIENLRQSLLQSISSPPVEIEKKPSVIETESGTPETLVSEEKKKKPKKVKKEKPGKKTEKKKGKKEENCCQEKLSGNEPPVVHEGITCDGCNEGPIIGIRYKCTTCFNFDLCETCEISLNHPHPLIKIRSPMKTSRQGVWQGCRQGWQGRQGPCNFGPIAQQIKQAICGNFMQGNPENEGFSNMFQQIKEAVIPYIKKEFKKKFKASVKSQKYPGEVLAFIGKNTQINWTVKNSGRNEWPAQTTLFLEEGPFDCKEINIGEVKPGQTVDVSVNVLPVNEGLAFGTWKLRVGEKVFGKMKAKVRVVADQKVMVLVENMGFDYWKAKQALEAANGDLNLAVSQVLKY